MIQIPIALTALEYTRPVVWNGRSLEFGSVTFVELEERIKNLRLNRSSTVALVNRIKLDLGKVRRFDFFSLDSNLKMVEKKLVQVVPLLTHLNYSQENMDERIKAYNELVELINSLYVKFKDAGLPILESVKANQAKVMVLQKRVQLMSTAIESMTLQETRMEVRLRNIDGRMRKINEQLSKLFASLQVLSSGNFELSGVISEIVSYETVVRIKIEKAAADLEELVRRVCEINIAMLEILAELGFLEVRLRALERKAVEVRSDLVIAEATLSKLQDNLNILRDFYHVAKSKLQSIENYLATFIIGGENVHLDFGSNYTVVNVMPPKMPPCLDPEPCPTETGGSLGLMSGASIGTELGNVVPYAPAPTSETPFVMPTLTSGAVVGSPDLESPVTQQLDTEATLEPIAVAPEYTPKSNSHYTNSLDLDLLGSFTLLVGNSTNHEILKGKVLYVDGYRDAQSREESLQEVKNAKTALSLIYLQTDLQILEVSGAQESKYCYDTMTIQ